LKVQDRVIRIEERQRCERLLPAELKSRIEEITPGQFVALRFASDTELPGLVNKVLTDKISDTKTIKQMVKNWRGDYLRA
jgi:transcription initiation factor TFIIIB Brf1 subunit/transcription initiation factor TFIIB